MELVIILRLVDIFFSDKDKYFINSVMAKDKIEEYIIWFIWYKKLKIPLSSIILCIVVSVKNKAFIKKIIQKKRKIKLF